MRNYYEKKLLREFVKNALVEMDSDLASGGALENPYGAHFVSNNDIYNLIVKPLMDPFKVAVGKMKEIKERAKTVITVAYEGIATSLNMTLTDDYEKIFDKEKQNLDKIKGEYKDAYEGIWGSFKSTDVAALAFFCAPAAVLGAKIARAAPEKTLSLMGTLSGGLLTYFVDDMKNKALDPDSKELNPFVYGKKSFDEYNVSRNRMVKESYVKSINERKKRKLPEKKDDSQKKRTYEDIIFSKGVISAAVNSPYAKKMKAEANKIVDDTLETILGRAKTISSATSFEQLKNILDIDKIEGIDKLKQIDPAERAAAEKKLLSGVKMSMKNFYVKNLEKQVSDAINVGVPKKSSFVKKYYDVINKIKSA